MENKNQLQVVPDTGKLSGKRWKLPVAKTVYSAFVAALGGMMLAQPTFAAEATDIWDKANEIMKDVYDQVLLISTQFSRTSTTVSLIAVLC